MIKRNFIKVLLLATGLLSLLLFLLYSYIAFNMEYYFFTKEEKYFHKTLSKTNNLEKENISLETATNFQWDYVCSIYSYNIYNQFDIEKSIGFKLNKEIPNTYGSSEGDALLIFISKENKEPIIVNADIIIERDLTKKNCNSKKSVILNLIKSDSYKKGSYNFNHKFILNNIGDNNE